MKHSMAKVMLQLQLLRLHMNSIRNRLGKQKVLRTMEGVGEGVIFTSHTAQTIENDLWLLKCLNWTATQYVKQTKIVCSPVGNRQVIWLKDLYSIQALICMHVHTCVHTHTHTHTLFFPPNFYCNEDEGKALDMEAWDMVLDFSEIQKLKETTKASVRSPYSEMVWDIPLIWTDKN